MDMKEKLAKLVHNARMNALWHNAQKPDEYIADLLMEDGVTVQEWISVKDRLPNEDEYTAKAKDGEEYYVRLLIAYKTDIVEYEIGYYDGYKWMTEMPIRLIKDVVAWMPFPNMPQPPKGE